MNLTEEQKEMINTAVQKIYEQGEPSATDSGACKYSTEDGNHCIVGWMIDPNKYNEHMEANDVFDLVDLCGGKIFYADVELGSDAIEVMGHLQGIHDEYVVETLDMSEVDKPNFKSHWKTKVNIYSRREGYTDWLEVKD